MSSILVATPVEAAPPAGFLVTIAADTVDVSAGDGQCTTVNNGGCSLRAAIMESNALPGTNTIALGLRVHELESAVLNADTPETGDFDITDSVVIIGQGAGSVVDGGEPPANAAEATGLDRLFEIHPTADTVRFENLTLREGYTTADGAGVLNWSSGTITFANVDLRANQAGGDGGAIHNGDPVEYDWLVPDPSHAYLPSGRIEIVDSLLTANAASAGAALYNSSDGVVEITDSQVNDNPGAMVPNPLVPSEMIPAPGVFEPDGGAIDNAGNHQGVGTIRITDSEVNRNWASQDGAGIANDGDGIVVLRSSEVRGNTTLGAGGGLSVHGGNVTIENGTDIVDNVAKDGGGIASDGASTTVGLRARLTVSDSAITGNKADGSGGGILAGGNGYVTITDSRVDDNRAGDAGGGLNIGDNASLELLRALVELNESHDEGGGAYVGSSRPATIVSSRFERNKAGTPEPPEPGQVVDPNAANIAGGGGLYTENGPLELTDSVLEENTASDEGGGLSIDNFGNVRITRTRVENNRAGTDGGGVENSGARVVFDQMTVIGNRAELDGGGIYNSSSGEFSILGTTVQLNSAVSGGGLANAPDNKMHIKDSLFWRNTARTPPRTEDGLPGDGGYGGGIWSMADGNTDLENTTISGNTAATGGGGLFHDADGDIKMSNVTIWRNKAPMGGGIGVVESDFVPTSPPSPNVSVMLRNTIVGGSTAGGSCDYYLTSEGGNVASGPGCFISVPGQDDISNVRDRIGNPQLDAIADNGGPTLTHMPRYGSLAIDTANNPCPEFDARGVARPQNGKCDSGAVEFEGPPPVADLQAPTAEYVSGPVQDSLETVAFTFKGTDPGNVTTPDELQFECRLLEIELTEPVEPLPPWEPVPPELAWQQCVSPWSVPLVEEGLFDFEVRAIDRAGNVGQVDRHSFDGTDQNPPNTIIEQSPTNPSTSRSATFTFTGIDNITPAAFMEYECRLDTLDPDLWLECVNPAIYGNLTSGSHTFEVRATDGNENVDPTPARFTWTVGLGANPNCDAANITLTSTRDTWVDEVNPTDTHQFDYEMGVASGVVTGPPRIGQNARALVKFDVPTDATGCTLESATLKLHANDATEGRALEALPLSGAFFESATTWANQPGVRTLVGPTAVAGLGYREFDVKGHVLAMMANPSTNHGWSIRDTVESQVDGGGQSFASREEPQDPPEQTLPLLELVYVADGSLPPPPPPEPTGAPVPVTCGMVVKESIRVANDLSCPFGEGLVIGEPNIVLDLNGHTIDGPNYLLENVGGQEEGFPAAIRNSGWTNVVIRNGTVQEFGYGVLLTSGTTRNVVENLEVYRHAMSGIELFDADDGRNGNTVRTSVIEDNELGVSLLAGTQNSKILDNTIGGNLGEQILVQFSSGNLLEGNDVHGIPSDPLLDSDGGILFEGSSRNTMRGGTLRDTGDAGVVINQGSNDNTVEDTVMWRNGDAGVIIIDSEGTTVDGITAHQESDGGVVVNNGHDTTIRNSQLQYNPSGVEASNSNDLRVINNNGSDSLQAGFEIGNGVNIVVRDNIANNTGGDGIALEAGTFDTAGMPVGGAIIEGNTTNENKGNGISTADGGHEIRDNDAHNNAGFGITIGENPEFPEDPWPHTNLAPPDIPGPMNRASNNLEVSNCSGLLCVETGNVPLTPPDLEGPEVTILSGPTLVSGPNSVSGSTSATFRFVGADNRTLSTGLVYECRLDPPPDPPAEPIDPELEPPEPGPTEPPEPTETLGWGECSSPVTYRGLENGPHHFEVRAHDQAEPPNEDLTPAAWDWQVDISVAEDPEPVDGLAPETRIASGPVQGSTTESTTATLAFAGSDDHTPGMYLGFECRLDGSTWSSCTTTNPKTYSGLTVGSHTFAVRATDAAGKTDATPASRTWTVQAAPTDTTPPDTTLLTHPDHVTTLRTATFTFTSDDPTATGFECKLDTGNWALCSDQVNRTHTVSGLSTNNDHDFRVRAVDPAGNRDPDPAGYTWFVGGTPTPGFVSCGDVITTSILVRNDLIDCLWDGLRVGANNITIDLDGHTIDGKGVAAGIRNDGFDNVTIKNGKVTDYDYGVMLNPNTQRNIVENVRLESNQEAALGLGQVPHPIDPGQPWPEPAPSSFQSQVLGNILRFNTINANELGIHLTNKATDTFVFDNDLLANKDHGVFVERSAANRIEKNTVSGSSGAGIELEGSNGNTILENQLIENGGGVYIGTTSTGTTGIPSNDNLIEKNNIVDPVEAGIAIEESVRNTVLANRVRGSHGDGLEMYKAQETLVKDNDFRTNLGGISLIGASNNWLESNDASDSLGTGISLEALSIANTLVNNISSDNDGDGIYVGDETSAGSGVWLEGNRTNGNKGYGIFVPKVAHTLKANIANDNGGWGIYASDGSNGRNNVDAGGNKAQGNMGPEDPITKKPMQCFYIRCDGVATTQPDPIAPDTQLLETPAGNNPDELQRFRFTGTDNVSTVEFQCSLDGSSWEPCTSPKTYARAELGTAVGTHTFAVRAVDLAGNVDLTPATHTWGVGALVVPPAAVDITSAPDPATVKTSARFEIKVSGIGTLECSLDGAAFTTTGCTSPITYSGLAVGEHSFTVRFTSAAGTGLQATDRHEWRITPAPVDTAVSCAQVVVRSIRLTNDLVNCPGNGLIIGAGSITVDLNGHTVDGTGLGTGIINSMGFDLVTITNGTAHEFDFGATLGAGSAQNIIDSMTFESNQETGVALADADQGGLGSTVRKSTVVGNGIGIAVLSNTRGALLLDNALGANSGAGVLLESATIAVVQGNEIANSSGPGIEITGGGSHQVLDNELKDNGFGIIVGEELLGSNNNYVERNSIVGGGGGITLTDSDGTVVRENKVRDTVGAGVALDLADSNVIRGNDVRANGDGISLAESSNNQVLSNIANDTLGTGIEIGALSFDNDVIGNTASLNGGEGITVDDAAPLGRETRIEDNTADGNGGSGIDVSALGHVLEDNNASLNGGWGIYAALADGRTDAGGNFAAGNAEPGQCYNVNCASAEIPGAPEVWLVDTPPTTTGSRNASFTWNGRDDVVPTHELLWECRLDSSDPLAWEDCEYPQEYFGLQPGPHTFEIRAVEPGTLLASTPKACVAPYTEPCSKYTWTYAPVAAGDPPTTTIDIKPPLNTFLPDAIFTFHADEPDVTFECRVDLNSWEPCGFDTASQSSQGAFEWGLTETEVGPHTFQVRAIDFEGNMESPPASYTWNLNGIVTTFTSGPGFTPGETPLDPPTGGPTTENDATITFQANMAEATYLCSLDLEPFTPCTGTVSYTDLLPGDHMLRVIATNGDLVEVEAAEYEWEIVDAGDSAPPETMLERAPAPGLPGTSDTVFEFLGVDNITYGPQLLFECRVNALGQPISSAPWEACTSPFNLLDLYTYEDPQMYPGEHTFEVRAIDSADPLVPDPSNPNFEGNVDPTPASHTWTVAPDTTPPTTQITSGLPATLGQQTEALIEFYGTDNATPELQLEFRCTLTRMDTPGGPTVVEVIEPCGTALPDGVPGMGLDVSGQLPGVYELTITAIDLAGNADLPPLATESWTVVSAPTTTIVSGPAGRVVEGGGFVPPSTSDQAVFTFTADQAGSTFLCSLDGAAFRRCTSPRAHFYITSGRHEFQVQAVNPQGVVEEPPVSYVWNVELGPDTTPPDTTVLSGPAAVDQSEVATFRFSGTDNRTAPATLSFECALDGTAFNSCTSPQQFSDLQPGSHTLRVRAKDAAGNFDLSPAVYTWTVQRPPVTTITTGPAQETGSRTATFTFSADTPGATYQCWFRNGLNAPVIDNTCTSPKTYTDLTSGENLFAVLATANGLGEEQWAEWEWTVGEVTAPVTIIRSGPGQEHEVSDPVDFVFDSSATGVDFTCTLDGTATPCTSPKSYRRLEVGAYTFTVSAMHPPEMWPLYDAPLESTYSFSVVDTVPPGAPIISYGPNPVMGSPNATFGLAAGEPGATLQCSLDNTGFGDCATPYLVEDVLPGAHTLDVRAVDAGGNLSPVTSWNWTHDPGPLNTESGTNVSVNVDIPGPRDATVSFFEVTLAGSTTIDVLAGGPAMPGGYGVSKHLDIHSTAEYGAPVKVCLPYDPADAAGRSARILHHDGAAWVDVTTTNDPVAGLVCAADVEGFSPFALAFGTGVHPLAALIATPDNPSNSSSATFTFTADVAGARLQCSLDGLPFENCTSPKTYTKLEEGGHSFSVQALGQNGLPHPTALPPLFEWEIVLPPDVTAPDTEITNGPADIIGEYLTSFEFTGTDDRTPDLDLEFECLLDGVLLGSCSSPQEVEVLAAGRHTFEVRAIDQAGLVDETPAKRSWITVDVNAPDTEILSGPPSETTGSIAVFEFAGEEPDGTPVNEFECSLDYADFAPCPTPYTLENLSVGPHVLEVRAKDAAGVVDSIPERYEWLRLGSNDTVAPETTIAAVPSDPSGPEVIFGFTADEPVAEYLCQLDNGPWEGCEAATELVGLASGQHTVRVRAVDLAEPPNTDATPASHTWNVVGHPETTITGSPETLSAARSATFTFTSDQSPAASFFCSVDGSPAVPCTSPYIAGPLVQDSHTFEVYAVNEYRDLEGFQIRDETPAEFEWTVQDLTGPETTIVSVVRLGPADLIEPDSIRFEITGSDNGTGLLDLEFECRLDNGPWEGCDVPFHYLPVLELAGGEHLMEIRAVDEWDNVDPTPAEHRFTTEAGPETTIASGPPEETDATTAQFTFAADPAAGATFQCSLDGALFTACPTNGLLENVPYGPHELLVRAVGPGGVADEAPAEYSWESGYLTAPTVTIQTGPPALTTATTASFTFIASDPTALFQCSLDGGPLVLCESGVSYTASQLSAAPRTDGPTGPHTLEVSATRPFQLVEGIADVWEWTIQDQTAPETQIRSGPEAFLALGTPAVFRFGSTNEPAASFECSFDGETYTGCATWPVEIAEFTLPAGVHTLSVRAVDPSLNVDASPATYTFEVVGAAVATIQSGPLDGTITTQRTATFAFAADQPGVAFTCSLDSAEPVACDSGTVSYGTGTPLAFGGHNFSVVATNRFGLAADPVTVSWTVAPPDGAVPPVTTIDPASAPPAITSAETASFAFAADQPSTYVCSLDQGAFLPCTTGQAYTDLTEGAHSFRVLATNLYGVAESAAAEYAWTVDYAPRTAILDGPPASTLSTTAVFNYHSPGDPQATFECSLDQGVSWSSCPESVPGSATFTSLAVGPQTLMVRAQDVNGFEDATPAEYAWTIEPPVETLIASDPVLDGPTTATSVTFTLTSPERPGATFECALDEAIDGDLWAPCPSVVELTNLEQGEHAFAARAVDAAGNKDLTPEVVEWEIGGNPPPVAITGGPGATTEARSATLAFTAAGTGLAYECQLDSGGWSACESPTTYTGLRYGAHTFEVRVLDPIALSEAPISTRTWTVIKLTRPETTLDRTPALVTGPGSDASPIAFQFSSNESSVTFECALNGAGFSGCESPQLYEGLVPGDHTFRVRAVDAAGQADLTPAQFGWRVAPEPQTTVVFGPEPDLISGADAAFEFSADLSGSNFQCRLNQGGWQDCSTPSLYALTGLTDGEWTLAVRAVSPDGIVDPTPAEWTWTVGLVPQTGIVSGPASPTVNTGASFAFSASEGGVTFWCSLDNGPFEECDPVEPADHVIPAVTVGTHSLRVAAQDADGNRDASPASWTWTVVPRPTTELTSTPAVTTAATSASFGFTSTDSAATFECSLDNAPFAACTSGVAYADLPLGNHRFEVRAVDANGFHDASPATHLWRITEAPDTLAPVTVITEAPAATTASTTAAFRYGTDPLELGVTYQCSLDSAAFTDCETARVQYDALAAGPHTFRVVATDAAGNTDASPAEYAWTIQEADSTPPVTTITSGPGGTTGGFTTATTATFEFSAGEAASYECSLDGAAFETCNSGVTYNGLSVGEFGEHTLQVRATDLAGNRELLPVLWEWTVEDGIGPDTQLTATPEVDTNGRAQDGNAIFEFSGTDNAPAGELTFECRLDSATLWTECISPEQYLGANALGSGEHTFRVRAVDGAGNADDSPATFTWTVPTPPDTTAPVITLTGGPADGTTGTGATFTFTASEDVTFACRVDQGEFGPCTSPQTLADLGVGQRSFSVRATDPAGNTSTESYTWTIAALPDTTPPVATFDDGPATQVATTTATLRWSADETATYQCRLDGIPNGSFNECTSPVNLHGLGVGEHTFEVRATDTAGNSAAPVVYRWEVMAPPTTTIDTSAAGTPADPTDQTTATFTFAANQAGSTFQCSIDEGPFESCNSGTASYSNLGTGDHTFEVVATGPAGNTDPTPDSFGWSIGDLTAPVVTIVSGPTATPAGGTTQSTSASFDIAVTDAEPDPTLIMSCQLDGGEPQVCDGPTKSYDNLAFGEHTFTLTATKRHLYADVVPVTWTWTVVDGDSPGTEILTGPAARIAEGTPATFTFRGTDNAPASGLTYTCRLDGGPAIPCTSPYELSAQPGEHTLAVTATDAAGNTDPTPATRTWTVVGEPITVVTGTVDGLTATFAFTADQTIGVSFECALDGGTWLADCTSPRTVAVTPGGHSLAVRATNSYGVTGPAASATVTATAPAGYTPTGADVAANTGPATITFADVTVAGVTTAAALADPPALPGSYLTAGAVYYDLTTTATYTGTITVCVTYEVGTLDPPVRLLHHSGGAWQDVTTSSDPVAGVVCGETTSLSPFAVVEVVPSTTIVDQPAASTADPNAVFGFTSDNPAATFQCALDVADAWGSCSAVETFEDLALGAHTLWVRAVMGERIDQSPADHTWTVRAPETIVESGPPARSVVTQATFSFASDSPGATFECSLDGGLYGSCPSTYELTVVPGSHTLDVTAKNTAGALDGTPASYTWAVKSAPDTSITESPADPTDSRTATFRFSSDTGTSFECSLDGAPFSACSSPQAYTGLAYESHDFAVRAVDADGDRDPSPAVHSWEIGEIPPAATIDTASVPVGDTEATSATFTFSTTGTGWTFECQLDGSPWTPCSSPQDYTGLASGSHTFRVQVYSPEAVVDVEPDTHIWRIADLTAPDTRIDFGPRTPTNATTAVFGFGSTEQGVTYECSLDGAAYASCSDPAELTGLAVGSHTIDVVAIDAEGNRDQSPARYTWTVVNDSAGPEVQITAKPAARTEATEATFSFSSNEAGSTFECQVDTGAWESCSVPEVVENLALGSHTFSARATDIFGNVGTPVSYDWLVVADATDPQTTLGNTPPATTLEQIARFTFTSDEADVFFECKLDQGAWTECNSPADYDVAVGDHTFAVRAVDAAGNRDQSPAEHTWAVLADTTAPETTIDSGPSGVTIQTTVTFGFSSSEAGSTFQCSIDAHGFSDCASPLQLTDVEPGTHSLRVRATDSAGNVDQSPATRTWTVAVRPETTLVEPLPQDGEGRSATFAFTADPAAGATFECRLDGGAWATCASPKTYTGVPVGERAFQVRAVSVEGFADLSPAQHAWTAEAVTVPDTVISTGPSTSTEDTTARFVFSSTEAGGTFQCRLDLASDWTTCTSPVDLTGLALGQHQFAVRALDTDGNIDGSPATFSWTVVAPPDTVDPETQVIDGPPATTSDTSATLRFTGSDDRPGDVTFECKLDNGSWTSCTSPASFTGLALGTHTVQVRAVDTAGNVDGSPPARAWTVEPPADSAGPQTTVSSGPADPTTSRTAAIAFAGTDDRTPATALSYECRLDNGGWATCASPVSHQNVTDGLHTVEVRAIDAAGNKDASPAFHQWFVRTASTTACGPQLTLNSTADAWIDQKSPSQNKGTDSILKVQGKSGSNNFRSLVRFSLPTAPANCVVSTATLRMYNASPKSGRTMQAIRLGAAWTESAVSWTNQPATAGPVVTTPSASTSGWSQWTVTPHVQAMLVTGANHGFLIRDAAENSGGGAEQQYHSREKGSEVPQLLVTFVPAPPDTTAPNTTVSGGPAAGSTTTARDATFVLASDEPGSSFECALDGGPFVACTSPASYTALTYGTHRFWVRARDVAGNPDATPVSVEWTISGP